MPAVFVLRGVQRSRLFLDVRSEGALPAVPTAGRLCRCGALPAKTLAPTFWAPKPLSPSAAAQRSARGRGWPRPGGSRSRHGRGEQSRFPPPVQRPRSVRAREAAGLSLLPCPKPGFAAGLLFNSSQKTRLLPSGDVAPRLWENGVGRIHLSWLGLLPSFLIASINSRKYAICGFFFFFLQNSAPSQLRTATLQIEQGRDLPDVRVRALKLHRRFHIASRTAALFGKCTFRPLCPHSRPRRSSVFSFPGASQPSQPRRALPDARSPPLLPQGSGQPPPRFTGAAA